MMIFLFVCWKKFEKRNTGVCHDQLSLLHKKAIKDRTTLTKLLRESLLRYFRIFKDKVTQLFAIRQLEKP